MSQQEGERHPEMDDEYQALEHRLIDPTTEPISLSYEFLEMITKNFTVLIASGGFGAVYKGYLPTVKKEVAVKRIQITEQFPVSEEKFEHELTCLKRVKHKNIVRFLGYCTDATLSQEEHHCNGNKVPAHYLHRVLCFEYVPDNNLQDYLTDNFRRHEWGPSYQLIEGICQGLNHLHNEQHICHLDLKPENILLDGMVPKIADFGLSRFFGGEQSRTITRNLYGTPGYIAPEHVDRGELSFKADIYSLGIIIIRLLIGSIAPLDLENWHQSLNTDWPRLERYTKIAQLCVDNDPRQRPTIDNIIDLMSGKETVIMIVPPASRRPRSNTGSSPEQVQSMDLSSAPSQLQQMNNVPTERWVLLKRLYRSRLNIGLPGLQPVREMARRTYGYFRTQKIGMSEAPSSLQRISGVPNGRPRETVNTEISKLLDIHPLELRFPFEPNKQVQRSLTLTNRSANYVAVWIRPVCRHRPGEECLVHMEWYPSSPLMHPHSTWAVVVVATARERRQQMVQQDTCVFEVVMVTLPEPDESLYRLVSQTTEMELKLNDEFFESVDGFGGEVYQAMLTASVILDDPAASCQDVIRIHKLIPAISNYGEVRCIDVHPTETRMLVAYETGHVSVFNYDGTLPQQRVEFKVLTRASGWRRPPCRIRSAKFITGEGERWFAAGLEDGWVHVYSCSTPDTAAPAGAPFPAHPSRRVTSLAAHPTESSFLTAADGDPWIKLWTRRSSDGAWMCAQKFNNQNGGSVQRLIFDVSAFASLSEQGVKVWDIQSPDPITLVEEASYCNFYNDNHGHFLIYGCRHTNYAHVWHLQTMNVVHKLQMTSTRIMYGIACHPTLPILATRSSRELYLWNGTTYRLERVQLNDDPIECMVSSSTKDVARLVVPCVEGISIMEISLPTLKPADLFTGELTEEARTPHAS